MNNLLAGGDASNTTDITNPALGDFLNNFITSAIAGPTAFLNYFIQNAVSLVFIIGAIIFLFMLITGGVQWISSGGDKGALENARGKLTNAIIGIVILFSAYALIKLIEGFFGISILTLDTGSLFIQ